MAVRQEIAMPAQGRVGPDQQHELPQLAYRQAVEQPSEEEPVIRRERGLGHLPLRRHQLMPEHQNFYVFVVIAPGQQAQEREGGRQHEVGQAQHHDRSSCRSLVQALETSAGAEIAHHAYDLRG
ncbi:hypothetical protein [Microtetraspora malaysiensis]|uniref:hypothetical protein n=1 Tax=Microtetraspora malaysiensis TaxID=161358 RepID=UPI003D91D7BC